MITTQKYYDALCKAARDGTFPSAEMIIHSDGSKSVAQCRYRFGEKRKCAIGILISDAEYDSKMEGQPVDHQLLKKIGIEDRVEGLAIDDLGTVQCLHDRMAVDWDADLFIRKINEFSFFKNVVKEEVSNG